MAEQNDANNAAGSSPVADANQGAGSSDAQKSGVDEQAQGGEDSSGDEKQTPFHEHPRFQEIRQQVSELTRQNEILQQQIQAKESNTGNNGKDPVKDYVKNFAGVLAISEKQAEALVNGLIEISSSHSLKSIEPLGLQVNTIAAERSIERFKSELPPETKKNWATYEPIMRQIFGSFPEDTKRALAHNPEGVSILFTLAEKQVLKKQADDSAKRKGGVAGANVSQSGSKKWTAEKIAALSVEDFQKHETEIQQALESGNIG